MDYFNYRGNDLYAEDILVKDLALKYGTPLYVYSKATLVRHVKAFDEALKSRRHRICYAVKANSNLAILNLMAKMGLGFDIVSEGELRRVIAAGGDPHKCVYSGVGKTPDEIRFALQVGVDCLNIESEAESFVISKVAKELDVVAKVALRVNPNVDAKTLPAISTGLKNNKFGIAQEDAIRIYKRMALDPNLKIIGIDCHIGSQMTSGTPIVEATLKLLEIYNALKDLGIEIEHIDLGGGLGVIYDDETPPTPEAYFAAVSEQLGDIDVALYVEPGRAMVANAGILLTKVQYQKTNGNRNFAIVDGAMNDLIRPALYGSWMNIINAQKREGVLSKFDIVGPVCESDDFLGKDRSLNIEDGDVLVVRGAGAYGSSMASNYNSRRLPCEVMVDGDKSYVIRARQNYNDIWKDENILPN